MANSYPLFLRERSILQNRNLARNVTHMVFVHICELFIDTVALLPFLPSIYL